jgi:biotin carboxylase
VRTIAKRQGLKRGGWVHTAVRGLRNPRPIDIILLQRAQWGMVLDRSTESGPGARMRSLMILGARPAQLPVYRSARRMGLRIIGADPDASAPGLRLADHAVHCDLADAARLIQVARQQAIDGAMTFAADYPMPALAALCETLGLHGPGVDVVHRATHKGAMRLAFRRAGVPGPDFVHVLSAQAARDAVRQLAADVVVKPAQSSGGRGVTRLPAGSPIADVDKAYAMAVSHSAAGQGVMVESFVDGPEFSVEIFFSRQRTQVIAVTDKLTSGAPHFVELGHQQPSQADAATRALIEEAALSAVRALGIDAAASHVELRMGPEGPALMECAARAGGGCISSHLVPLSTGVDLIGACISIALGDQPDLGASAAPGAAAIRFLTARPGRLLAIQGLEAARAVEGVVEVQTYFEPGHEIGELLDARARCGHVIAASDRVPLAVKRADAATRATGT